MLAYLLLKIRILGTISYLFIQVLILVIVLLSVIVLTVLK